MLAVDSFIRPEVGSRQYNAIIKAKDVAPQVDPLGTVRGRRYFIVEGSFGTERIVRFWKDRDGEMWIQCMSCRAGYPPIDRKTRLPQYEPSPCYHAAATLLQFNEESTNGSKPTRKKRAKGALPANSGKPRAYKIERRDRRRD